VTTYFKAIRPDGSSFHDRSFAWATEPGGITTHPLYRKHERDESTAGGYLSVSTVPTDCTGMRWPCRLLEVEPVGRMWTPESVDLPNKRAALRWRTVRELSATNALGPQGAELAALIDRCRTLTDDESRQLDAAWDAARVAAWDAAWDAARVAAWDAARVAARGAAWDAARDAARDAAWDAARVAAWDAAWDAARVAAWALTIRDLIGDTFTQAQYDQLTMPWRTVIGPLHPDDAPIEATP
jgi:hypothetical protein